MVIGVDGVVVRRCNGKGMGVQGDWRIDGGEGRIRKESVCVCE